MIDVHNLELEKRDVEVRYVKERHPVRNFLINIILILVIITIIAWLPMSPLVVGFMMSLGVK